MSTDALLAGGFGGACLTIVGAPFDYVKVRQQFSLGQSAISVCQSVLRKEGLRGLFRGVGPPLLVSIPQFAVVFWAFDASRRLVRSWTDSTADEEDSLQAVALAGAMVAVPTTFIYTPVDRIKCLYQVDGTHGQVSRYGSVGACLRAVAWHGGISSLFRGFRATLIRDVLGWSVYFTVYAAAKRSLATNDHSDVLDGRSSFTPLATLCAGALAGMSTWAVAIPFDSIKTWRQTGSHPTCTARPPELILP